MRATCRMAGTAKGTVLRLFAETGEACYRWPSTSRTMTCAVHIRRSPRRAKDIHRTSAMVAGLADHAWTVPDLVALLDSRAAHSAVPARLWVC